MANISCIKHKQTVDKIVSIFLLLRPEVNVTPDPRSSQCTTVEMEFNACKKSNVLHLLAFLNLLLVHFGNSAAY